MNKKFEEPKFEKTEFEAVAYLRGGSSNSYKSHKKGNKKSNKNSSRCKGINAFEMPV